MQINGPNGTFANVTDENKLSVDGVFEPEFLHYNDGSATAYVWNFTTGYTAANSDTIMFIRNDSDKKLHIHHVYVFCSTASTLTLHRPANPTAAGTVVTGRNINSTSGNVAEATAIQDETGNTQGVILHDEYIAANAPLTMLKEDGYEVILGKNDCLAIDVGSGDTPTTYGHIVGYFHD